MLTNNKNVPDIFVQAMQGIKPEDRSDFDYSATRLIASPRQVQLQLRHAEEDTDIMDIFYTFIGNSVHDQMEKGLKNNDRFLVENRIIREEQVGGGTRTVSGKPDLYDKELCKLYDYKTSTTWIHGKEAKKEWEEQLNIYAFMLEEQGYPIKEASIIVFYKDWRERASKYKDDDAYPATPVAEFPVKLLPQEERRKFYYTKLMEHVAEESTPDDNLPLCKEEDMWEKPAKFAVYKPGADRAMRLCDSREDAERYIQWKKATGVQIEHRPGERTRCKDYCSAAPYCNQYQEYLKKQEQSTIEDILDAPL